MTEVYVFDRGSAEIPESAAALLPGWRRELLDRLKNENARRESLCAGLLFAYAMERRGLSRDVAVERLPAGKPVLCGRDGVCFSLSHSGRWVLCAVSDRQVGADVQEIRPVRMSIARRFHPAEQAWLESVPGETRDAALFRLWARKEAWVKAVSNERVLSLAEADVLSPLPGLAFRDYVLPDGCAAAVCTAAGEEIPPLETVSPAALMTAKE